MVNKVVTFNVKRWFQVFQSIRQHKLLEKETCTPNLMPYFATKASWYLHAWRWCWCVRSTFISGGQHGGCSLLIRAGWYRTAHTTHFQCVLFWKMPQNCWRCGFCNFSRRGVWTVQVHLLCIFFGYTSIFSCSWQMPVDTFFCECFSYRRDGVPVA